MPRAPHRFREHAICLGIVYECLFLRVPAMPASQPDRNIVNLAYSIRAHGNIDRTGRLSARLDGVEEVPVVAAALVQMNLIRADSRGQERFGMGIQLAAIYADPALASAKEDALAKTLNLVGMLTAGHVVHVDHLKTVGESILDLPANGTIGDSIPGKLALAFDLNRPGFFCPASPLCNIHMMNSPVAYEADAVVGYVIP